jgi:hypothetical protein
VAEPAPPPPLTARSQAEIQADIDRAAACLRALRAEQAEAHFTARPAIAARIQLIQEKLDRLYEEKRRARSSFGAPPRRTRAADVAARLFAES